jgi:catechol 2,3-dioxygenase-like lactoylglutathione lyase family enzyme
MLVLSRIVKGTAMDGEAPAPASVPASPASRPSAAPRAVAALGAKRGIVGIDSVLFAVDDVSHCASFLTDIGLERQHVGKDGAVFSVSGEQSQVRLLRHDDAAVPAPWAKGDSLRQVVWGVSDKDALRAIADELSKDRDVKEDAEGRLLVTGPFGMPLAFEVSHAKHVIEPVVSPSSGRVDSRIPTHDRAQPSHLGHVGMFCPDIEEAAAFYGRLGFRISDRITEFGVFLRSPATIDHHNVFFIKRDQPGLNHLNFRVADVDELGTGTTYLERRGWRPVWGLGRHYYGSHMFSFFDNPCGSYLEFTCDEDYILDDSKWQPVEYDPRLKPMTLWGGMPPKELYMGEKPSAVERPAA